MSAAQQTGLGIPPRTLVAVFATMAGLFALTTLLARWYEHERVARARRYYEVGIELAAKGRQADAFESLRNALVVSRGDARYRLAVAEALVRLGRLDEAAIYFHEVLAADPGDGLSNLMLARISARRGQGEQAVIYYQRAIFGHWMRDAGANRMAARWELIDLLGKEGLDKQVVAALLEAADQAPGDPATLKRIGSMLLRYGSARQAAEIFHDALRASPRDAEAHAGLGEAELALGDYRAADAALRRAVREDPHSAAVKQSLASVEQVLSRDPTEPGLSTAERYRRSRALAEQSLAALERCLASQKSAPEPDRDLAASARKSLYGRRRPRRGGESADATLALAERLWAARKDACRSAANADPILTRVMARLSR